MDPDATLAIVTDDYYSPDERIEALLSLNDWHDNGGFPPNGTIPDKVIRWLGSYGHADAYAIALKLRKAWGEQ